MAFRRLQSNGASILAVLLTALSILSCAYPRVSLAQDAKQILIGVSTALTGEVAVSGQDVRDALMYTNRKFLGNRYRLIFEDDRCDGKTARSVAEKLVHVDKVRYVMGIFCNAALLSSAPIYNKNGIIVVTSGATSGDVLDIGATIFRPYPPDNLGASLLYDYISANHRVLGVITEYEEYTALMERTILRRNASSSRPMKIFTEQILPGTHDFKSALLRLHAKGVDAFFFNSMAEPGYMQMVKAARRMGLIQPHYSSMLAGSPAALAGLGTLDEGTLFANLPLFESGLSGESAQIWRDYVREMGSPRSVPFVVALVIDAFRMLDDAIQSGRPVADYLHHETHHGLVGEMAFDAYGAIKGLQYTIHRIHGGKVVAK